MKLYFGNAITTVTTLMLFALLGFIGWSVVNRSSIQYWGRRAVSTHQRAYHRWLCRRTVDYCCCHCYADCKDAKDARGLVLCDVEWYSAENRDDGDCADHFLKGKGNVPVPIIQNY